MPSRIDDLRHHIALLEREIEGPARHPRAVALSHRAGRVASSASAERPARLKQRIPRFIRASSTVSILPEAVIYSLIVTIALLDLWISAYKRVCFPAYGIARVRRSAYIVIDRHHLAYLNAIEKANCMFCSYANGVFAYVREIAARTEQYWCPIRHARSIRAPHAHYQHFVEFGDAEGYHRRLPVLRADLAAADAKPPAEPPPT